MGISNNPDGVAPDNPDGDALKEFYEKQPEGWQTRQDWEQLLLAIYRQRCTPFLGAGANAGVLRLGQAISMDWAKEYHYPFPNSDNLPRVAQFVTLTKGGTLLIDKLALEFAGKQPDFNNLDEPHRAVAELDLPIYITTNYDNFMVSALIAAGKKPSREACHWRWVRRPSLTQQNSVGSTVNPTPENPIVFHLHGNLEEEDSMVLTEDDYLNFLINISEFEVIPSHIAPAFANYKTFLFVGYSLEDINFKVLFQKFAKRIQSGPGVRHVAVQLPDIKGLTEDQKEARLDYLEKLFENMQVKVYWGEAKQFAASLREQWTDFKSRQDRNDSGNGH